jgi:hypothetical protein
MMVFAVRIEHALDVAVQRATKRLRWKAQPLPTCGRQGLAGGWREARGMVLGVAPRTRRQSNCDSQVVTSRYNKQGAQIFGSASLRAPPVHMVRLTETRSITPYRWVHPDDEDR